MRVILLTTGKMVSRASKRNGNDYVFERNLNKNVYLH